MNRHITIKVPARVHDFLKTEWGFSVLALALWIPTMAVGSTVMLSL